MGIANACQLGVETLPAMWVHRGWVEIVNSFAGLALTAKALQLITGMPAITV